MPLSSYPIAFTVGTMLNCDAHTGACTIEFAHDLSVHAYNIDAVMALEHKDVSQSCDDASRTHVSLQQGLPSVLQSAGRSLPVPLAIAPRSDLTQPRQRQAVSTALLAVKDLLLRKEQIVTALAALNARAARGRDDKAPAVSDATAVNDSASTADGPLTVDTRGGGDDRWLLERQCAWLVQNLDATNRSLQLALVELQQCTRESTVRLRAEELLVSCAKVWGSQRRSCSAHLFACVCSRSRRYKQTLQHQHTRQYRPLCLRLLSTHMTRPSRSASST